MTSTSTAEASTSRRLGAILKAMGSEKRKMQATQLAHVKAAPLGLAALRLLIEDCGPRVMGRDNIHLAVRALKAFSLPQNAHHHHLLAAN